MSVDETFPDFLDAADRAKPSAKVEEGGKDKDEKDERSPSENITGTDKT